MVKMPSSCGLRNLVSALPDANKRSVGPTALEPPMQLDAIIGPHEIKIDNAAGYFMRFGIACCGSDSVAHLLWDAAADENAFVFSRECAIECDRAPVIRCVGFS